MLARRLVRAGCAVLLAACGGDGTDSGNGGLSPQERTQIATTLGAVAAGVATTGDTALAPLMRAAAALVQDGADLTSVSIVTDLSVVGGEVGAASAAAGSYSALALQAALMYPNGTILPDVGAYAGALVVQPTGEIILGLDQFQATNQVFPAFVGLLIRSANEVWAATAMTGGGVADSILGGDCRGSAPSYVVECVRVSMAGAGFNITQSAPLAFPGNTATGSRAAVLGFRRLRGVSVTADCTQTTAC